MWEIWMTLTFNPSLQTLRNKPAHFNRGQTPNLMFAGSLWTDLNNLIMASWCVLIIRSFFLLFYCKYVWWKINNYFAYFAFSWVMKWKLFTLLLRHDCILWSHVRLLTLSALIPVNTHTHTGRTQPMGLSARQIQEEETLLSSCLANILWFLLLSYIFISVHFHHTPSFLFLTRFYTSHELSCLGCSRQGSYTKTNPYHRTYHKHTL